MPELVVCNLAQGVTMDDGTTIPRCTYFEDGFCEEGTPHERDEFCAPAKCNTHRPKFNGRIVLAECVPVEVQDA